MSLLQPPRPSVARVDCGRMAGTRTARTRRLRRVRETESSLALNRMTHPGEQFYPEGVRWDDPIARGTLPDLLSNAAGRIRRAAGDRIPRPADQLCRTGSDGRGRGRGVPARRLRQEHFGGAVPRQLAGSSREFLRRAESRRPHRASFARSTASARCRTSCSDSGARVLVTSDLAALLPTALKFLEKGLLDRLIVCEDDDWGAVGNPHTPIPDHPAIVDVQAVRRRRDQARAMADGRRR